MEDPLFQNSDKRQFNRKQLYYYLKVYNEETDMPAGFLGDISTQGLMLFTKESIEKDTILTLRIHLDNGFDLDENLVVEARSLWCETDVNPDYFIVGFSFVDIDQAGIDTVKYLTQKYGFEK